MLSESSYMTALYSYTGAALLIMLYLGWWLSRHFGAGLVALAVLLAGALLLTPAYPREAVETFAPALLVAVMQYVTEGQEGAMHALRPLGFTSAVAVVLAFLLRIIFFRHPRKPRRKPKGKAGPKAGAKSEAGTKARTAANRTKGASRPSPAAQAAWSPPPKPHARS